jgi:hypothetical protein
MRQIERADPNLSIGAKERGGVLGCFGRAAAGRARGSWYRRCP